MSSHPCVSSLNHFLTAAFSDDALSARLESQLDLEGGLADALEEMRAKEKEARERQKDAVLRSAMAKMINSTTANCMSAWRRYVARTKRETQITRKVITFLRNRNMGGCFAQWAGAVRASVKQKQQDAYSKQSQALQQVLSRLDPDGDGVVDQDEFTSWAKEQAMRVEMMEQQVHCLPP